MRIQSFTRPAARFAVAALVLVAGEALASSYQGQVTDVTDGDTVKIRVTETCPATDCPARGETLRVRFAEIDAPESDQPYGDTSTRHLARLIGGEVVRLEQTDTDRYGRAIAHVVLDGTWINAWMVGEGHAWVYPDYAESAELFDLEDHAQSQRRGLWRKADPVAPWEWRRR